VVRPRPHRHPLTGKQGRTGTVNTPSASFGQWLFLTPIVCPDVFGVYSVRSYPLWTGLSTHRVHQKVKQVPASDRIQIAKLARASRSRLISSADASKALSVDAKTTGAKLASLAERGWLRRVRRGVYLIVPLETEPGKMATVADPWILAQEVFSPCYIGGWSAAEYWELTEQIFRPTLVVTAAAIRSKSIEILGQEYRLFRVPASRVRIATSVWRDSVKVKVSSRERTLVDCLRNPALSGGVGHLILMMKEYANHPEHDFKKLLKEAREAESGAVWKRLGYLTEMLGPKEESIVSEASRKLTAGNIKLDPLVKTRGKLVKRWGVWSNVDLATHD
jgi:predicted transcriptional regulator of viral defense system